MTQGWSFRDRSFLSALLLSLLWHCFWFFSVSIVVTTRRPMHVKPEIVSLGPVLDDSIFRTLAETRPEISETFYRRLSDFSKPADLEVKTLDRYVSGEVVSLPFGQRVLNSIRSLVGGTKQSPDLDLVSRIGIHYSQETEGLEGELKGRPMAAKPEAPKLPAGFDVSFEGTEIVFDFTVDPEGVVSDIQKVQSSGNRDIDLLWEDYLRHWRFTPAAGPSASGNPKGRVRFRIRS